MAEFELSQQISSGHASEGTYLDTTFLRAAYFRTSGYVHHRQFSVTYCSADRVLLRWEYVWYSTLNTRERTAFPMTTLGRDVDTALECSR